jgi:protein tyrosine/serine phosphatase
VTLTARGRFAVRLAVRFAALSLLFGATLVAGCNDGVPMPPGALPFNFHVVSDGRTYRSAQPTAGTLYSAVTQLQLKTVLNLRGEHPDETWWQDEQAVCRSTGVTLVNLPMSANELPSRETLLGLYDALASAQYPILIHCQSGADRTGAAAAIWRMMDGDSRDAAQAELSPLYFHFEQFTPAMDLLVSVFEPDRDWIANVYDRDTIGR